MAIHLHDEVGDVAAIRRFDLQRFEHVGRMTFMGQGTVAVMRGGYAASRQNKGRAKMNGQHGFHAHARTADIDGIDWRQHTADVTFYGLGAGSDIRRCFVTA